MNRNCMRALISSLVPRFQYTSSRTLNILASTFIQMEDEEDRLNIMILMGESASSADFRRAHLQFLIQSTQSFRAGTISRRF